ncbi:hypothetical protein F2Q69_00020022 [Brassica cretica]|uniref:Uncharacterized protein n=1 Tax=Brassica cretica TaxID=69181 RepID=A0A8S9QAH4_BRACR|nr:hypothetical protein F2Q69_00020022 [Brassica cretica]
MDQEMKLREMGATMRNGGSFTQKLRLDEDKQRKAMDIMKKMNVERLSELIAFYTLMGKISSESNTALSMDQEMKLREMGATMRNGGLFTQKLRLDEDKQRKAMNIMKKMNVERLSELIAFYTLMGKISSEVLERKLNGSLDDHSLTSQ